MITKLLLVCLFTLSNYGKSGSSVKQQERLGVRWDTNSCKSINQLFVNKERVMRKLKTVLRSKKEKKMLSVAQIKAINIYQVELNDTERAVFEALGGLRKLLHEDFKSVIHIKEAVKQRLDASKDLTLHQEDQYNAILGVLEAEKELITANKLQGSNNNTSILGKLLQGVLSDISLSADKLEEKLNDNTFEKSKKVKGASIEAVVRLDEKEDDADNDANGGTDASQKDDDDNKNGMSILVDSQDNQFVLSKSKDATIPHEDLHLIRDIICIIVLSFIGALFCSLVHLPTMFGFVLSGMLLGPTGMNVIKSVVQVETLGEFGVFFILFCVGLEFSPDRIKKVWKVSVGGSTLMMVLIIIFGMFWGTCFGILPQQSAFVAACLSLSSTPLVVKFLDSKHSEHSNKEHTNGDKDYSSSLLGILVMQDVHLGLLVAILPSLAGRKGSSPVKPNSGMMHHILHGKDHSNVTGAFEEFVNTTWILFEVSASLLGLSILCVLFARYLIGPFYRHLQRLGSPEFLFLGTVTLAFAMLTLTDHLGISMELGCFVAGVVISSHGEQVVKLVTNLVEPVRDLFSCLFFASIGLHVFPSFVLNELSVTLTLTLGVVALKFFVGVLVLRLFLPQTSNSKYIVASGLAQVSEFSFVLGSRARRFHLISREVYLIILSVTTLSLLFAPLVWRASLWRYGEKRQGSERFVKPIRAADKHHV